MKRLRTKSALLFLIYFISVFIFALAYNACFSQEYEKIKDCDILSDSYAVIRFNEEKPDFQTLNEWVKDAPCHYVIGVMEWSQGKSISFTEEFFRDMKIDTSYLNDIKPDADVASVNEDALDMCYEGENGRYLKLHGIAYKVIAIYKDYKDDKLNETYYYLNQNAKSLQGKKWYDVVLLDPVAGAPLKTVVNMFKETFTDISVSEWTGAQQGIVDTRPYFVMVTMVVALLLCVNCVGFSNEWVKAQVPEFGIRKLVGATERQNHYLMLKRFLTMFFVSYGCGLLLAMIALYTLKNTSSLSATRGLFGTYLYGKSALYAGISVAVIGFLITEYSLLFLRKRNILANIRGRR